MATFKVSSSELRNRAEQLRGLNAQFKSEVSALESQEQSLMGMWEGDAKNAFDRAFKSDKIQMDNFYNAVEMYVARLESAAGRYDQAESVNVEIANQRNYQ